MFTKDGIRTYEKYPVKGFQSSMEIPLLIGLQNTQVDSAVLIWPDNSFQRIDLRKSQTVKYRSGLLKFDFRSLAKKEVADYSVKNITTAVNLLHQHLENPFNEFDREPLIPHMVSREGPALAIADINKDGLDDLFIGSSKGTKSSIYIQGTDGRFQRSVQTALDGDSTYEDVDACWIDVNNDSNIDLVVASGGNEYYGNDEHQVSRVYVNDGTLKFRRLENAFPGIYVTASCIVPYDINDDGYMDLFLGARAEPWEYGRIPKSHILLNDKTGHFKDGTVQYGPDLTTIGFVKAAKWFDLDKDGDKDLIVSLEWDGIYVLLNDKGKLRKKQLTDKKGWWNFTLPIDVDNDGDVDLIAGNNGLNSRFKPTKQHPVKLYYNDFDNNGKREQVLTYYLGGKEIPFANKGELEKQMPLLKKKFLYAEDFARASLNDLFSSEKLQSAEVLSVDYFSNAVLINDGKMNFSVNDLPWQAQLTTYKDALIVDANGDDLPDVFMTGNFYDNNIQMSRYDADYGTMLINKGLGSFEVQTLPDLVIKGQVKKMRHLKTKTGKAIVLVRNNDSTMVLQLQGSR